MSTAPTDAEIIHTVADDLPVGVWVARAPGGEFVYANNTFAEILGIGPRDDVGVGEYAAPYGIYGRDGKLYPEDRMPFVQAVRAREIVIVDDIVIHRPDGRQVFIRATARPVLDQDGEISHVIIAFIDISREALAERARQDSEKRLQAAQRLESIGNLAGGIAHDFNNLLASIKMLASMMRMTETDPAKRDDLQRMEEITDRAVQLTRSLLGFAGRGKNLVAPVALHGVVQGIVDIIRRTFDRRIEIITELTATGDVVTGDRSQLDQVVMNLVVNARDAMPQGGRLVLRTSDATLGEHDAGPKLPPGPYVVLEVEDSGTGIPDEAVGRVFEPYFTTKTIGGVVGTGLGLATVFGIVESHGGKVEVAATSTAGTTLRVWLPCQRTERREAVTPPRTTLSGLGTVLLVEDEPAVRRTTARALEMLGYRVLVAQDGREALTLFQNHDAEICAMVLDMVMPRMDGRATWLALRELRPDLPVVLTTGYSLNEEAQSILDLGVREFLLKPYDLESLAEALVRAMSRQS